MAPPVNKALTPHEADNDATAELPVLDIEAFEATMSMEAPTHSDTWVMPPTAAAVVKARAALPSGDTVAMPVLPAAHATVEIPTLRAADFDDDIETDDTGEMPGPQRATLSAAEYAANDEWRAALARAERRIEELQERMRIGDAERAVAIARANAECAQLREQLAGQLETISTVQQRLGVRNADVPALEDEIFVRDDRIADLEKTLAAQSRALNEKTAMLAEVQRRRGALESDQISLRAMIARRDAHIATLGADLQARQEREAELAARLAAQIAQIHPDVPALRAEIALRDEQLRTLTIELNESRAKAREGEDDLGVAEESIRRLEAEIRERNHRIEQISATAGEWQTVIAESQRAINDRDTLIRKLEADLDARMPVNDPLAETGQEVTLEGPARVLIRTDGNTEFVHVLGRRTRIGRGVDNEIVLDTKHISRYHAVLLAGPVHTSIEDLNSTNGVFVNNKRIARQVLKDGDRVTVGRTQFRFTVRG